MMGIDINSAIYMASIIGGLVLGLNLFGQPIFSWTPSIELQRSKELATLFESPKYEITILSKSPNSSLIVKKSAKI